MRPRRSLIPCSLLLLALTSASLAGCAARSAPNPPTAPSAPAPPGRPNPPVLSKLRPPQVPAVQAAIGVGVEAVPAKFPVPKSDVMVVAIPEGAIGGTSGAGGPPKAPSFDEMVYRHSFITAFLRNGYVVKDGGILSAGSLTMRRYPATEAERSEVVREGGSDGKVVKETTTTTTSADRDWWHWNTGLTVAIKDPTSLWAPELLQYQALKAPYFLRVFRIDTDSRVTRSVPGKIDPGSYSAYSAAVRDYNAAAEEQVRVLSSYEQELEKYAQAVERYQAEYSRYEQEFEQYVRATSEFNALYPLLAVPLSSKSPPRDTAVPPVFKPAPQELLSQQQLLDRGLSSNVSVNVVTVLAEVVQAPSGRVVWAGRITSVGDADHGQLIGAAIDKVTSQ
jgi:hypothetical protein